MLSWMNLLILLLVKASSLNATVLSSNLLRSSGGRKRTTPLGSEQRDRHPISWSPPSSTERSPPTGHAAFSEAH